MSSDDVSQGSDAVPFLRHGVSERNRQCFAPNASRETISAKEIFKTTCHTVLLEEVRTRRQKEERTKTCISGGSFFLSYSING